MNDFTNFSVASFSFHGLLKMKAIDLFGYLESAKYRYGLQTADIWNGMIANYETDYTDFLKRALDERGLTVVNLCCDWAHVWDNDEAVRAKNEEMAWKCIALGEKLGAKTIRIDAGFREETLSDEQVEYVSKKYREYCRRAAEFGAKLGTENHWGATRNPKNVQTLFDAVNEANFGLLLHLGNWDSGDKDLNDLAFIKKAMHIHIDFEHCAEAERVLPPLVSGGYSGCWAIESHKATNEYNNVALQLAQVTRVICPLQYNLAPK
ncbi:MAG: sugar phosphate isomerase/epimerase [Clostridiales bacterium]|jgi:sugar phosphate isomerase/epimerase|nr:sugar phosphate isomerase/epimerase [Clostridiales bacterium]